MDCCEPPHPTDAEHQLAVRGFVALWNGERPRLTELGADPALVEAMRRSGRIVIAGDGRVVGIHGLSAESTPHHIAHDGRVISTWCAFDAIGIPAALRLDARAVTTCPTCGRQLHVDFVAGQPTAEPDLRLWLPQSQCDHLLADFCAHANLYCNDQHLAADDTRPPGGATLTPGEAATLGRTTWAAAAESVH